VAVAGGVKRHAGAMALGAAAPLVVTTILLQRMGRRKIVLQVRRLKTNLGPHIDRVAEERERWKSDLSVGEVIEWALQSPMFNPRPKA